MSKSAYPSLSSVAVARYDSFLRLGYADLFCTRLKSYFLTAPYQQTFNTFVGPCEVLVSGDTLQVEDYSKLDWEWSMFDPEKKKERRETVFPGECRKAFEMGRDLAEKTI